MFGKNQHEQGERVLVVLKADMRAKEVTVLGEGTFEGLFVHGDEDGTDPISRSDSLKMLLGGQRVAPRIRLDSGEVCWGDEVYWGDLAGGLEWLRQFVVVTKTTMADVRRAAQEELERQQQAEQDVTSWRVDPPPDVTDWRCD